MGWSKTATCRLITQRSQLQILPLRYQGHGLRDVGSSIISDHGELVFLIAWSAGGLNLERLRCSRPNCDSGPRLYQCDIETSLQEGMGCSVLTGPALSSMRALTMKDRSRSWSGI
jgi:hypothetical protein